MTGRGAGAQAAPLTGGRLHLHHGPIDLILGIEGPGPAVRAARERAWRGFQGLLEQLVAELPLLRAPVGGTQPPRAAGPVARRMVAAVWPHRASFVTPMAAVAGAVADEILAQVRSVSGVTRAYVNNGGDIAFHLTPGTAFRAGVVTDLAAGWPEALAAVGAGDSWRGLATSGAGGRSFSLGIADSVTVLARDAATADALATLIANAVDADDPAVKRRPAVELDPDSDLGTRPVTVSVGPLDAATVARALEAGVTCAASFLEDGWIGGALLSCKGETRALVPHPDAAARGIFFPRA